MKNLTFVVALLFSSYFMFGQFGGCGNRINSVIFSPIVGTNDITVSINSSCCDVHSLDNHSYNNTTTSTNHNITLCYRDSGLLMQTTITENILLPNANLSGTQNVSLNAYFYFGIPGEQCSTSNIFNAPITLSFIGPLTEPRVFTLANNEFETRKFSLFPNPNKGDFSIDLPTNFGEVQVRIFDVLGKEVYSNRSYSSGNTIQIPNRTNGFYFAKIISEQSNETIKFVID